MNTSIHLAKKTHNIQLISTGSYQNFQKIMVKHIQIFMSKGTNTEQMSDWILPHMTGYESYV